MDRRSFVLSLFGGLAAASLGGVAVANAASRNPVAPAAPSDEIDAGLKAALDTADTEFTQYYRRPPHRRPPPPPPRHRRRRRRVVRNGRVYYVY